jgi:hypothetical protein
MDETSDSCGSAPEKCQNRIIVRDQKRQKPAVPVKGRRARCPVPQAASS